MLCPRWPIRLWHVNRLQDMQPTAGSCIFCWRLRRYMYSVDWVVVGYTYIGWITVDCFAPERLRVVAHAQAAHARPGHVQQPVGHRVALEVHTVLLEASWNGREWEIVSSVSQVVGLGQETNPVCMTSIEGGWSWLNVYNLFMQYLQRRKLWILHRPLDLCVSRFQLDQSLQINVVEMQRLSIQERLEFHPVTLCGISWPTLHRGRAPCHLMDSTFNYMVRLAGTIWNGSVGLLLLGRWNVVYEWWEKLKRKKS